MSKINELNKEQRPRERLINGGAKSLSDVELLAIILSFGNKKENVIELSTRLIKEYGFSKLLYINNFEASRWARGYLAMRWSSRL